LDSQTRKKIGKKAVYVAISGNIMLTILNFVVGTLSGSVALVAESSHTLSDVLTSIITSVGFRIGMMPPDSEHPYGHGRAEPLAGLVIVVFLCIVAFEILSEVYRKLLAGGNLNPPDMTAAFMALVGIGVNLAMTTYMMRAGKRIKSPAIVADAQHQKVDIFSCTAILIGVIGSRLGIPVLDPIVAIFISIIVLKTAFNIGRENINNIMGTVPSHEVLVDIKKAALSVEGVLGVHNVKINYVGPYASLDLHVEVKADLTLKEAHRIAHDVERNVIDGVEIVTMVNVHVCPKGEDRFCVECVNKIS
jgi:cation diffusion facilitator family transporter